MMHPPQGRLGEIRRPVPAGDVEPMLHILNHLLPFKRVQVVADGNALAQLSQTRIVQPGAQLGLAK